MENLLILHGWGSKAGNWEKVQGLLEKDGVKVFVPDLPGFGNNPPPEKAWSVDNYVNWVKDFCDKNNLSSFFLLGHSFGGGLAVRLYSSLPEKIRGLILVGAKIRRQKMIRYYFALTLGKLGKIIFSVPVFALLRPWSRKLLYNFVGTRDYYKLDVEKAITMKETFKEVVKVDSSPYLSKIKIPVLIIWGDRDQLTPLKDAYFINRQVGNSRLEVLKGGRHELNLQMPEILAEKIIKFMHQL